MSIGWLVTVGVIFLLLISTQFTDSAFRAFCALACSGLFVVIIESRNSERKKAE